MTPEQDGSKFGSISFVHWIRIFPENTRRRFDAVLMMDHLLRRWPSVNPILDGRHLFAG